MFKFLWMDTETTGLDPKENDVIQVAALAEIIVNGESSVFEFIRNIRPFNFDSITDKSLAVHGIAKQDMEGFAPGDEVYYEFKKFLSQYVDPYNRNDKFVLCGQNVDFDCQFISSFFLKNNDPYWFSFIRSAFLDLRQICLMYELRRQEFIFPNYKLQTVCNVLKVDLEGAHDALVDVRATRECILKLYSKI